MFYADTTLRCFGWISSWSYWLAVWDDFAVEFVHGHEGRGVRVELEEPVSGQLSSVLVPDQLDLVERVVFPHQAQGVPDEVLRHVGLQLEDK